MSSILLVLVNIISVLAQYENKINYYDKLISEGIQKSKSYVCPTDNSKFFETNNNENQVIKDKEKYDFIVVGAGASGAVIASRLSEVKQWKILLIEAGEYEDDFSDIPMMCGWNVNSERNWCFKTTPQKNALFKYENNQTSFIRGKSVGGSTVLNGLGYTRGNKKDYDDWAAEGNPGWSYKEVLPYFKKSENVRIIHNYGYHGQYGVLPVDYIKLPEIRAPTEYTQVFIRGGKYFNVSFNYDFNGVSQMGISKFQYNVQGRTRMSTGRTFLRQAQRRSNLKIITKSLVTKVLIKDSKAYGIEFMNNGILYQALVTKEVIVSGGVINSPQILMLSGIGPEDELKKLNIKTVVNLPVGKNAVEQNGFRLNFKTTFPEKLTIFKRSEIKKYLDGFGFFTNPVINAYYPTLAFVNLKNSSVDYPDTEITLAVPIDFVSKADGKMFPNNFNIFQFVVIHLRPESRGEITLKSNNPKEFPNINLNMFSESQDVDSIYEGIQFILKLTSTEPFKKINTELTDSNPACSSKFTFNTKDYWYCAIRYGSEPYLHMVGATRMGPTPKNSVVDSKLKVHGVENLRVADAGVIPVPISGHTSAPTMMVGEKAADIIKTFYEVI